MVTTRVNDDHEDGLVDLFEDECDVTGWFQITDLKSVGTSPPFLKTVVNFDLLKKNIFFPNLNLIKSVR